MPSSSCTIVLEYGMQAPNHMVAVWIWFYTLLNFYSITYKPAWRSLFFEQGHMKQQIAEHLLDTAAKN